MAEQDCFCSSSKQAHKGDGKDDITMQGFQPTPVACWVAEPYVQREFNSVLIVSSPSTLIGVPVLRGPDNTIRMTLVSRNPLVHTMTIKVPCV